MQLFTVSCELTQNIVCVPSCLVGLGCLIGCCDWSRAWMNPSLSWVCFRDSAPSSCPSVGSPLSIPRQTPCWESPGCHQCGLIVCVILCSKLGNRLAPAVRTA